MRLSAGVIVTQRPQEVLAELEAQRGDEVFTIIDSQEREFLVEHADEVIAKAYVASEVVNYIIMVAPRFSLISQNRLLKIFEEPPRNKEFILITKSKSSILDTIKSRLPITVLHDARDEDHFSLDVANLNLAKVYEFVQENNRISTVECKNLVEKISTLAIKSGRYNLDKSILNHFSNSIKALEVGSPVTFILNGLLLKLLAKKRRS